MPAGRFVVGVGGTEGIVTFGTAGDQCGLTSKESARIWLVFLFSDGRISFVVLKFFLEVIDFSKDTVL